MLDSTETNITFDKTKVDELKALWKQIAATKNFSASDVFTYNVIRAMRSKSNNKIEVAKGLLYKAFTPAKNKNRLANGYTPFKALELIINYSSYGWTANNKKLLATLTEEELKQFTSLVRDLRSEKWNDPTFAYIFTRQDISKEQQLVQTAHCTLVLGQQTEVKGDNLHFCVFGVKDGFELSKRLNDLESKGIEIVIFFEPDLNNGEITSFACYPMRRSYAARKKLFVNDSLLTFVE